MEESEWIQGHYWEAREVWYAKWKGRIRNGERQLDSIESQRDLVVGGGKKGSLG